MRFSLSKRIVLFFIILSTVILGGIICYTFIYTKQHMLKDTEKTMRLILNEKNSHVQQAIESYFSKTKGILYTIQNVNDITTTDSANLIITKNLKSALEKNSHYISLKLYLKNDKQIIRYDGGINEYGKIVVEKQALDVVEQEKDNAYVLMKDMEQAVFQEPEWFYNASSKKDKRLAMDVCIPIIKNGVSLGFIVAKINVDFLSNILTTTMYKGSYILLSTQNGKVLYSSDAKHIGQKRADIFGDKINIFDNFKNNLAEHQSDFFFAKQDPIAQNDGFYCIKLLEFDNIKTNWEIILFNPKTNIVNRLFNYMLLSIILVVMCIVVIAISIYILMNKNVAKPLVNISTTLHYLVKGNVNVKKVETNRNDEIKQIYDSINTLSESLKKIVHFAEDIGKGKINSEYTKFSDNDEIGEALLNMRQSLIDASTQETQRQKEDDELKWETEGISKIGDILRRNNKNLEELSFSLITALLDYIQALQGSLYIKEEDENGMITFNCTSSIGFDIDKEHEQNIEMGDGLVGQCAFEEATIYMENVPDDYKQIKSGLGQTKPKALILVPIKLEEKVLGVLEIMSINKLSKQEIHFLETISKGIALTIFNVKNTDKTQNLLKQYRKQEKELLTQEEEIRQNLEELQATQEEVSRLKAAEDERLADIQNINNFIKEVIDELPFNVIVKNYTGSVIALNNSVSESLGIETEQLLKMPEKELVSLLGNLNIIDPFDYLVVDNNKMEISSFVKDNETIENIKIPIKLEHLDTMGIICLQHNITDRVDKKARIKELKEQINNSKR